jgi:tRNA 2-thiouridine synthesizing protein A
MRVFLLPDAPQPKENEMTTQSTSPLADTRFDVEFDASGLLCPLPVYRAALALGQLTKGQVLRLVTTDPGSLEDIPAMARQRGDTLLSAERHQDHQVFLIEKGARS